MTKTTKQSQKPKKSAKAATTMKKAPKLPAEAPSPNPTVEIITGQQLPAAERGPRRDAKKRQSKRPAESKPKRVSALDAAAQVLKSASQPMTAKDLVDAMAKEGLWTSPAGRTPHATLYAALHREIAAKGKAARFAKADRGLFLFNVQAGQ